MNAPGSARSAEPAELTDLEAARLAQQLASDRFLPISMRHYEAYLNHRRSSSDGAVYDRRDLEALWVMLLAEAFLEVETIRDAVLVGRLQAEARAALRHRYPDDSADPLGQADPHAVASRKHIN